MFIRPAEGRISSPFGMRTHPVTKKPTTMHWGMDIAKQGHVPVLAAANGTVSRVQSDGTFGTYGNLVMIVHTIGGRTYETVYAHLRSYNVRVGQIVRVGQAIGVMGNTGGSTGQHLHFEVHLGRWNNRYSNAKNPVHYMVDPAVKTLQELFVKAGYKITVDGINGPATEAATKAFQKANGLVVDGSAGPLTMDKLNTVVKEKEGVLTLSQYKELLGKIESLERKLGTGRDVSKGFENDFKWAEDKGLLDGSRPSHPVTREQLAAVLHRFNETNNLTPTAKNDLKELLEKAYNAGQDGVFTVDHSKDVDSMPGHQVLNLLASFINRTYKPKENDE